MADVKLLASQRLTDNPDGGGLETSTEIDDGVVNNLWPDISRVDRAYGVVNMRKLYLKADTADTAIYSGLHCICLFPAQDPRVTITMFSTNSWSDVRADAQSAIERYLDLSVVSRMIPFDRQLAGQRTILVFQRPELDLPEIGTVYGIVSLPDEAAQQFFRVIDVHHEVDTFTDLDSGADFKARVITLTISEPLQSTFQGSQPTRFFIAAPNTSKVRKTIVSDAVNFHTVQTLANDAAIGDLTVKLSSVFTQLVPASTSEANVLSQQPGQSVTLVQASNASFTLCREQAFLVPAYSPMSVTPGSVTVIGAGGTIVGTYVDDDAGNIILQGSPTTIVGNVDYVVGSFITSVSGFGGQSGHFWQGIPAAAVSKISQTFQQPVTQSTRGYVYNATLHPTPAPGSLSVSYRALGKWYTLTDDGSGALTGDVGTGTGSLNFLSSTAAVTLGALPDIGSSIIYSYGGDTDYEIRTGDVTIDKPVINGTLPAGNCKPTTFSVSWLSGGVTKTATDSGGTGVLSGDATGRVVYGNGTFSIKPTLLPDPTTAFAITYQASTVHTETFNPSHSGSSISVTVAHFPVRQKSVLITYIGTLPPDGPAAPATRTVNFQCFDDGAGNIVDPSGAIMGTINYTTGVITWIPDFPYTTPLITYEQFDHEGPQRLVDSVTGYYSPAVLPGKWPVSFAASGINLIPFVNGSAVVVTYKEDSATDTARTYSLPAPPLTVDLTPTVVNSVVPGGVMFTLGGRTYIDRAGSLYYDISPATGAGTLGGTIDYATGIATVTSWVGGASAAIALNALLTQFGTLPTTVLNGRTPGSPLRPASFYIQANKLDGTLISATADTDGNIATSHMHGYVDVTTGVYSVLFGAYALDSSLTSDQKLEAWYDSGNVDGSGYIFVPDPVIPTSIRYNCVVQTQSPLDSTILGIDPVRLPQDGRVQAVRDGYMMILHDSVATAMPGGLTAGQVVTLPRDALALVEVRDQTGAVVPGQVAGGAVVTGAKFTADYAAGTITMATPLDLSAFTQPLVATHRIEDASIVTDVQITGHVNLAEPLTHAYTAANSLASTALIAPFVGGSVQAAYNHLFSQQTWDSAHPNWTDAVIGSGTTAAFDEVNYPIQVLNRDAVTEKWALIFTSSTAFNIVAENFGVIGTGNTSTDVSPINPGTTPNPYFFLDHRGFGAGWAAGNAIRFDTQGAGMPIWLARTIKNGPASFTDDFDVIEPRWDKS